MDGCQDQASHDEYANFAGRVPVRLFRIFSVKPLEELVGIAVQMSPHQSIELVLNQFGVVVDIDLSD